ncbi:MAG: hypothetical protein ACRDRW_10905 [Pseudonocardiaceae bacterium]
MTTQVPPVGCPECDGSHEHQPIYDHIHEVTVLPCARHAEDWVVVSGYGVGIRGSGLRQTWMFFEYLEPALVFGRAGRMSSDVSSYGVYAAAREVRFNDMLGRPPITQVNPGESG